MFLFVLPMLDLYESVLPMLALYESVLPILALYESVLPMLALYESVFTNASFVWISFRWRDVKLVCHCVHIFEKHSVQQ